MKYSPRRRFWLEAGLALVSLAAVLLTAAWSDWIETVFGVDPDHGNGSLEWALVAVLVIAAVSFMALARREWRRVGVVPA